MNSLEAFLWGALGGLFIVFIQMYPILANSKIPPAYLKSPFFWIIQVIEAMLSGVVVLLYHTNGMPLSSPVLAVNIGLSFPLIMAEVLKSTQLKPGGIKGDEASQPENS